MKKKKVDDENGFGEWVGFHECHSLIIDYNITWPIVHSAGGLYERKGFEIGGTICRRCS